MSCIKICGLKRIEDILAVNEYKPDFIGFVFANTKRFVTDETAAELKSKLDHSIRAVGVFVDEPIAHIVKLVSEKSIDVIQLHGHEDVNYVNQLRDELSKKVGLQYIGEETRIPIIKAVRIEADSSVQNNTKDDKIDSLTASNQKLIDEAKLSEPDYLLFDSKVKGIPGGSGQRFDIAGLPDNASIGLPYFLAGGITPDNVRELIELKNPFGIDVSSAVETNDYKDKMKIKSMIDAVRNFYFREEKL